MMSQPSEGRAGTCRERRTYTRTAGKFCILTLLLSVAGTVSLTTLRPAPAMRHPAVPLTPIAYPLPTDAEPARPTPVVTITVDAQNAPNTDSPPLREVLNGVTSLPGGLPDDKPGDAASLPAWFAWARLNKPRAAIQVNIPSALSANSLGVYAVRGDWGATLCLVNKTDARLLTNAQLRLPRGVYTIERLTFCNRSQGSGVRGQGEEKTEEETAQENREGVHEVDRGTGNSNPIPNPQSSILNRQSAIVLLEHLEGSDLGGMTTVRKGFCLEPGQVCFYRCIDTARDARVAWFDVFTQLKSMESKHPGPARRLATMLHEADSYVGGVHGGGSRGDGEQSRLGCIHHLLLVTAQAHSLHHNYQMRHTVNEDSGKAVMAALDRLTNSLSETSAVLLGLVPQVTVTREQDSGVREQGKDGNTVIKETNPVPSNSGAGESRTITITLANTGGRSISNVKLGLNLADLSPGVTCEPGDPAYFDALHPGQTARATFHARSKSGGDLTNVTFTGDVSYFAGTAPAHLRPRAW